MITEKVSFSEPIVTVREKEGCWESAVWYSDNTGFCDKKNYDTQQAAEKAAKAWAEVNKAVYVAPNQTFISVFYVKTRLPHVFTVCEVPFQGNVVGKAGYGFIDFASAVRDAKNIAEKEDKPFAPHFYVGKAITQFIEVPKPKSTSSRKDDLK